MTCQTARDRMIDLFDTGEEQERLPDLRRHVDNCAACRGEFEELKLALEAVSPAKQHRASADFKERVMSKLMAEAVSAESSGGESRWKSRTWRLALAFGLPDNSATRS